jgi:hypothetical protein
MTRALMLSELTRGGKTQFGEITRWVWALEYPAVISAMCIAICSSHKGYLKGLTNRIMAPENARTIELLQSSATAACLMGHFLAEEALEGLMYED